MRSRLPDCTVRPGGSPSDLQAAPIQEGQRLRRTQQGDEGGPGGAGEADAGPTRVVADDKFISKLTVEKTWCHTAEQERTVIELRLR